ncbi:NAD(P)H-hydrate dehydratase [Brevibacillus sp. B_LB10_24]|uniref:NAD(P)H-hydrate dehydratase n=1 Tax=Brevibacillus sp. B_LB10_24 TaxID=3380645 RepID=UPI0038BD4C9A
MYVLTAEEMRKLDEHTIKAIGLPAIVLMENAGAAVAREVERFSRESGLARPGRSARWAVLAGKGNNGGDGLVAARHLIESGMEATVIYAVSPEQLSGDAGFQRDLASRLGVPTQTYGRAPIDWHSYDGIVDALIGTGSKGAPRGSYAELIRAANESGLPIISVDIPSGLDPDTGRVHDPCIRAARTVALAFLKRGLVQQPGAETAGQVAVGQIGIWPDLARQFGIHTYLLGERLFREEFGLDPALPRKPDSHKGTFGHLLVCAGSRQMSGAGLLCSKAALRAGSGLVTWAVPDELLPALIGRVPEVMLSGIPGTGHDLQNVQSLLQLFTDRDAAVIGPGLGRFSGDAKWLRLLWEKSDCPLVLDADALNMLADADFAAWPRRGGEVILTPHPGEMSRLAGATTAEVQQNRIEVAKSYALRHHVVVVLKGAGTVVAAPDGAVYINPTGNPGMATAGSGDVLAGVIGSLAAQGFQASLAACLGVWLHGAAGDRAAAKRHDQGSLIAGDIIEEL